MSLQALHDTTDYPIITPRSIPASGCLSIILSPISHFLSAHAASTFEHLRVTEIIACLATRNITPSPLLSPTPCSYWGPFASVIGVKLGGSEETIKPEWKRACLGPPICGFRP